MSRKDEIINKLVERGYDKQRVETLLPVVLEQYGLTEEALDTLTDDQIIDITHEIIKECNNNTMSREEMIQNLIERGFSEEVLRDFSDEKVLEVYQSANEAECIPDDETYIDDYDVDDDEGIAEDLLEDEVEGIIQALMDVGEDEEDLRGMDLDELRELYAEYTDVSDMIPNEDFDEFMEHESFD